MCCQTYTGLELLVGIAEASLQLGNEENMRTLVSYSAFSVAVILHLYLDSKYSLSERQLRQDALVFPKVIRKCAVF